MAVSTPLKDAHLVRFDSLRARGWQVRLPLWHPLSKQREYTEFFSDTKHGNETSAKDAARARRDALFAQEKLPLRLRATTTNKSNTTGLVGVSLAFDGRYKGLSAFSWMALWTEENGQKRRQRFRLTVCGFEEALRRAIQLREEKTGLFFSEEQLLHALLLWKEVDYYVRTGRRVRRRARKPVRTRPLPAAPERPSLSTLANSRKQMHTALASST